MAKITSVSPLAPAAFPELPVIDGVRFASVAAGVRYAGRTDVMLTLLDPGSTVAGVFTRSATRSANVLDCQSKIGGDSDAGAAIIVNSGNSNAFTGKAGDGSVAAICAAVAKATGLPETRVFTSSTGVIGERLPHDRIIAKVDDLVASLEPGKGDEAARAIMTTDTFPKGACATVALPGGEVKIAGFAKGSGMIAPDMATMLVYIFTDAKVSRADLQTMVSEINDRSFNCITVDSDTSTSDTLLMGATGASGVEVTLADSDFAQALEGVFLDLAHQVVKDGEGATKFVTVQVNGGGNHQECLDVAYAVAHSPLIKTALFASDPNWGRILAAVGYAGVPELDVSKIDVFLGEVCIASQGGRSPSYTEEQGAAVMAREEITIRIELGRGSCSETIWTTDLSHEYVKINAEYRT